MSSRTKDVDVVGRHEGLKGRLYGLSTKDVVGRFRRQGGTAAAVTRSSFGRLIWSSAVFHVLCPAPSKVCYGVGKRELRIHV